ncbi:hypothetical protein B0H10DRAFT_2318204 [Mycena sp. CBHHK59/15]|nr:hypothetical protein B0H10DRAFT_2318204 [Mycena sp. CBHHK59/15]
MAPGRARLDPDVKREHVVEARRRYEEKDRDSHSIGWVWVTSSGQICELLPRPQGDGKADAQALRKKHTVAHALPPSSARKPPASVTLRPKTPGLSTSPEPIALAPLHDRLQRCPHCYDDGCIGCACMCPDSYEWFKHAGGHFFPTCDGCGRECPGCSYQPSQSLLLNHADPPLRTHLRAGPWPRKPLELRGPFYAVIHREWKGAVTSLESLEKILERYPGAKVWQAEPWSMFQSLWNIDCTEYHYHPEEEVTKSLPPPSMALAEALQPSLPPPLPSLTPPLYSSLPASRPHACHPRPPGLPLPSRPPPTSACPSLALQARVTDWRRRGVRWMDPLWDERQRLVEELKKVPKNILAIGSNKRPTGKGVGSVGLQPNQYLCKSSRPNPFTIRSKVDAVLRGYELVPCSLTASVKVTACLFINCIGSPYVNTTSSTAVTLPTMPKNPPALSAHASRNLTKPVQQPRRRGQQSDAAKASRALAAKIRGDKNTMLNDRFKEIFAEREEQITSLAEEFDKTEAYIRQVLENGVRYTKKRATNLAFEGGARGNVRDINIKGAEYRAYRDSFSEERKAELIEQLEDHKDLKQHGVHATNKVVAMDAMQTSHQAGRVLINLHSRTGTCGFAMFTRGAIDDAAIPCWVDSDNTHLFFPEVLGISVYDMLCKLELWSCNRNKELGANDPCRESRRQ